MSSTYGDKIKISVFGESHGNGIGVVIDGLPAGFEVDFDRVLTQMARRAPGKDKTATPRKEKRPPEGSFGYARQQADRRSALCRN